MSLVGNGIIGIRREDKNRWERRVALTPSNVAELVGKGLQIIVQPSKNRIFADKEYQDAGATLSEDLSPASFIIAVKEVPIDLIIPNRNYLFFSHIIKAQDYNMPLLDAMLEKNIRLFDYERIRDANGQRLVRFGQYAGTAGAIDGLSFIGNRLLAQGIQTPFLQVGLSFMYKSVEEAQEDIRDIGSQIAEVGLNPELCPFVFTLTGGNGQCATGSMSILSQLPHVMVESPEGLAALFDEGAEVNNKVIYICKLGSKDWVEPIDESATFDRKDFYTHGAEKYRSVFAEKYAPYTKVLINGMYWENEYPRLLSIQETKELKEQGKLGIEFNIDVSCDIGGSVEWLLDSTSIDDPYFIYDVDTGKPTDDIYSDGIFVLAVDNLPCELAQEASEFFGEHLMPFVEEMAHSNGSLPFEQQTDVCDEVRSAILLANGELAPNFTYIADMRAAREQTFHHVLLLGAGLVTPPLMNHLLEHTKAMITIASLNAEEGNRLCAANGIRCRAVQLNTLEEPEKLSNLVAQSDVVISLLPAFMHTEVAKACIANQKPMVNASYTNDDMRALSDEIEAAGIPIVTEMGLDPGLDHMFARTLIDQVHAEGGKVKELYSHCGGLPTAKDSGNALGYKFSWSPAGVLAAVHREAKYLLDSQVVSVEPKDLYTNVLDVHWFNAYNVEAVPNHDSTHFAQEYGVSDYVDTFVRGTLRYKGYFETVHAMDQLGLLSDEGMDALQAEAEELTWMQLMAILVECEAEQEAVVKAIYQKLVSLEYNNSQAAQITRKLDDLGIVSNDFKVSRKSNVKAALVDLLTDRLSYQDGEHDLVLLVVSVVAEFENGRKRELTLELEQHGDDEFTAMSKTVGLPVAVTVQSILEGKLTKTGLLTPSDSEVNEVVSAGLKELGVWGRYSDLELWDLE